VVEEFSGEHNPTYIQDEYIALRIQDNNSEEVNQQELGMTKTEASSFIQGEYLYVPPIFIISSKISCFLFPFFIILLITL